MPRQRSASRSPGQGNSKENTLTTAKRNLDHTGLVDSANIKQVRSLLNMR